MSQPKKDCPFKEAARSGGLFEGPVGDDWWKCSCEYCQAEKREAKAKPDGPAKAARSKARWTKFQESLLKVVRFPLKRTFCLLEVVVLGQLLFVSTEPWWVVMLVIIVVCIVVSMMQRAVGIKPT